MHTLDIHSISLMNSSVTSFDEKSLHMLHGPANWSDDEATDEVVDESMNESVEDLIGEFDEDSEDERKHARRLSQPRLRTIGEMMEIAIARGGKCLSIVYRGYSENLQWQCRDNHTWPATPRNVVQYGSWCPYCNGNVGEELVRATLCEAFPEKPFERTRREWWLGGLELDGYNSELKLAFEFQGKQHFMRVPHFHRKDGEFESQQVRDARKRELCKQNGVILLEIPYTVKSNNIRATVRQMLIDLAFTIADATRSDDAFYNTCRANPLGDRHLAFAKEIANVKGGVCHATKCMGYDFKMKFTCRDSHEFMASLQDINQVRSRGPRFCPTCGGTQKKSDDEIRARVEAIGYRLISIETKFIGGKDRRRLTVQCPENHNSYDVNMDGLISKDGSLNKECKDCGHAKTGKSKRSDISDWLKKTGFSVIGEYQGGAKPSAWKCPLGHVFEVTFVSLKQRKKPCLICKRAGI